MSFSASVAIASVLVLLTACSHDRLTRPQQDSSLSLLARGIGLALHDASVRVDVRNAMRASLLVEHKLPLQAFLRSVEGRSLIERIALELEMEPDGVLDLAGRLPPLQFYVWGTTHRQSWRGDGNVAVAATLDNDRLPPTAILSDGTVERFDKRHLVRTLFVLEPLENEDRRIQPQPDVPGDVIQEPGDGITGGLLVRFDASNRITEEIQLADLVARLDADTGVALTTIASIDSTFIDQFWTNVDDAGSSEIMFETNYFDRFGKQIEYVHLRITGIDTGTTYHWHRVLIFRRIADSSAEKIKIQLLEDDSVNDDFLGERDFTVGDRAELREISYGGHRSKIELDWTPKNWIFNEGSASAAINGPASIRPTMSCYYYASAGITDPMYEWRIGDAVISNDPDIYIQRSTDFTLELQVWNASGDGASVVKDVDVSSSHPECWVE